MGVGMSLIPMGKNSYGFMQRCAILEIFLSDFQSIASDVLEFLLFNN